MSSSRISDLLQQIENSTGVSLSLNEAATFVDENETVEFLEKVLLPYKKRPENEVFLLSLLHGDINEDDINLFLNKNGISQKAGCVVYIMNISTGFDDTITGIIRDLSERHDYIVSIDSNTKALVCFTENYKTEEKISQHAATIGDTLTADALVPVKISYDGTVCPIADTFISYNHAMLAMQIGTRFFTQINSYCYHKLGLEKLIYRLSEEDCREYLSDHMHGFAFSSLSGEMSSTIHAFFDAGLSVAQASRNMYIHRNTLLYRLDKFQKLSGLDLRNFDDAVTAKIALLMEMRLS